MLHPCTAAHGGQIACEEGLAVHVIQRLEQAELELADDADLALDFPRSGGEQRDSVDFPRSGGGQRDGVSPRALQPPSLPVMGAASLSEIEASGDAALMSSEGELLRGRLHGGSGELGGGASPTTSAPSTALLSEMLRNSPGSADAAGLCRVPPISGPVSAPSTTCLSEMLRDSSGSVDPASHGGVLPDSAPELHGMGEGTRAQMPHPSLLIQRSSQSQPHIQRQGQLSRAASASAADPGEKGLSGAQQQQQQQSGRWKLLTGSTVDGVKVGVTALRMGDFR